MNRPGERGPESTRGEVTHIPSAGTGEAPRGEETHAEGIGYEAPGGPLLVEVLASHDCPNAGPTLERVGEIVRRLAPGAWVASRSVANLREAETLGMPGSPTVRIAGADLEGDPAGPPALACRLYQGSGVPPGWLIEAALLRALGPRHVLFLCVANSARSQMAEGLARALAPEGVRISSAGSAPTRVRPEALRALEEWGADTRGLRSKGVAEVADASVDAVITLCAEEACPAWLKPAHRVHWALPDPAAGGGEGGIEAFRRVRDELARRLRVVWAKPAGAPAASPRP